MLNLDTFKLWTAVLSSGYEFQAWKVVIRGTNYSKSTGKRKTYWNVNANTVILTPASENSVPAVKPPSFSADEDSFFMNPWQLFPLEGCSFSGKTKWLSSFSWALSFMMAQLYCLLQALSLSTLGFGNSLLWPNKICCYCWMTDLKKLACRVLVEMWELTYWEIHKNQFSLLSDSAGERNQQTEHRSSGFGFYFFIVLGTCRSDFDSWGCSAVLKMSLKASALSKPLLL